jgi:hypothetical protein
MCFRRLGILLALTSAAWAQTAPDSPKILNIVVAPDGSNTRVEITLTAPAGTPLVSVASNPNRIFLELPGIVPGDWQMAVTINHDGVNTVQSIVDNNPHHPVTRVAIELAVPRAYDIATDGYKVILTLLPPEKRATEGKKRRGPAGAASAPLISRIRRRPDEVAQASTPHSEAPIPNPPSLPSTSSSPGQTAAETQSSKSAAATPLQPGTSVAGESETPASLPAPQGSDTGADANATLSQANPDLHVAFRIKYVAEGVAYLEGGRNDGLNAGMKLEVKAIDPSEKSTAKTSAEAQPVADLEIASAALSSAVGEIHNPARPVQVGDWAYLSSEDTQALIAQRSLSATRKFPVVIAFSEGDTLDDEARVVIPRPPLPEINRARGRIGFDYSGVSTHDAGGGLSSNAGMLIRTDITRINGTYWNLNGFWRGRINNHSHAGQDTVQDLINRTYTIGLTYDNPNSRWVAGFGRLYLPWATSLDTIDGGYFGRRLKPGVTAGIFAGSSPNPTSWNYDPNRRTAGAFVNFEGGTFDNVRFTSTSGFGLGLLKWNVDRPFVFFENGIFYKRYFSVYHALQADSPSGNPQVAAPGAGISRSFLTVRLQPTMRVEFDLNHTYFRDIPTYNASLIDTGLLDKYLFQGVSGGVRVQVVKDIWVYNLLGRSNRSGDAKPSWNQLYGVTVGRMPWINTRTDVHYSKFDSSFGSGSYTSLSLSRNFNDNLRWEVLAGRQAFTSSTTRDTSHFVTGNFEASLGPRYFLQTGYTWNRGVGQNYDQWLLTFGYRFDSRMKGK